MSLSEQKTQTNELEKLNKKVGALLAMSRKVTQLHQFLQLKTAELKKSGKQSVLHNISAQINKLSDMSDVNHLNKSPEDIAETFWMLLMRLMCGLDSDDNRLAKSERGTLWLGSWAKKNGIDELLELEEFSRDVGFEVEIINIFRAIFAAVPVTDALVPILDRVIRASCRIDYQVHILEHESEEDSSSESSSDSDAAPGESGDEEDAPKEDEAQEEDSDADTADGFEVDEATAETKTADQLMYDKLIEVHTKITQMFFVELIKDDMFSIDVADSMKKARAATKAATAVSKKRSAGDEAGSPEKEAKTESEEDDDAAGSV
jgi:hypothetical protein